MSLALRVATGVLAGACLVGCTPTDLRRKVLRSWGTDLVIPLYRDTEARLDELGAAAAVLCTSAGDASLDAARVSWSRVRAPWKQAEPFAFGPYEEEPLRLGPKIDFWPARAESIAALLGGTEPITTEVLAASGAAERGLPAIEYLLYEGGAPLTAAFAPGSRRCAYLTAAIADTRARVVELRRAWEPDGGDFVGAIVEAGRDGARYDNLPFAFGEVVSRMAYTVENIRADKLGKPLGTTGGAPHPELAESQWSGRALEDARDALLGVERMYFGAEGEGALGLDDYLHWRDLYDYDGLLRRELARSRAALDAVGEPLATAIAAHPARVQAAIDALGGLQRLVEVDVLGALSVSVGFNNDGD